MWMANGESKNIGSGNKRYFISQRASIISAYKDRISSEEREKGLVTYAPTDQVQNQPKSQRGTLLYGGAF